MHTTPLPSHFISYKGYTLEYLVFGEGTEPLLAFHGYGREAADFIVLNPTLGKHFKIYSFNLFYHGNSKVAAAETHPAFDKADLAGIFHVFFTEHGISRFSLAGYSLGGKLALSLINCFAPQINGVYLFAPDGLCIEYWYHIVSGTAIGRKTYLWLIEHPSIFFNIAATLKFAHLLHEKLYRFVCSQMETREKRQLVYDVWMIFRKITPNMPEIQGLVKKHTIQLHVFLGEYDVIIRPGFAKYLGQLNNSKYVHIIPMGHNLLSERMNELLLAHLE